MLTQEQADAIRAYEAKQPGVAQWLVWSVAALGGLAIAGGIISLIAANWDEIPDTLKLCLGVAVLAALPLFALRYSGRAHDWPRDLLLFIHQLLVLAVIGLVGQVFHLSGAPWRPLAVATVFAIPAALAATRSLLIDVVILGCLGTATAVFVELSWWDVLWRGANPGFAFGVCLGAIFYSGAVLLAKYERLAVSLRRWGVGLTAVVVVLSAGFWIIDPSRDRDASFALSAIFLSVGAATLAAVFRKFDLPHIAALGMMALLVFGPQLGHRLESLASVEVVGFVVTGGFCLAWAFVAADRGSRHGVNLATFCLAARLVIAFFQLFETLTDTGIGLLLTGVVLIATAFGWWRFRRIIPIKGAAA